MLELHEKIAKVSFAMHDAGASADADAIDALVALGWSARDAREALKNIPKEIDRTDLRIKEALKKIREVNSRGLRNDIFVLYPLSQFFLLS